METICDRWYYMRVDTVQWCEDGSYLKKTRPSTYNVL